MDPGDAPAVSRQDGNETSAVELRCAAIARHVHRLVQGDAYPVHEFLPLIRGHDARLRNANRLCVSHRQFHGPRVQVQLGNLIVVAQLVEHVRSDQDVRQGCQRLEVVHHLVPDGFIAQQSGFEGAKARWTGCTADGGDTDLDQTDEKLHERSEGLEILLQDLQLETLAAVGPGDPPRHRTHEEELKLVHQEARLVGSHPARYGVPLPLRHALAVEELLDPLRHLQGQHQRRKRDGTLARKELRHLLAQG
eukprot:scaffold639_cov304-Pinguiococcus_pyrenoidosus.AAC.12